MDPGTEVRGCGCEGRGVSPQDGERKLHREMEELRLAEQVMMAPMTAVRSITWNLTCIAQRSATWGPAKLGWIRYNLQVAARGLIKGAGPRTPPCTWGASSCHPCHTHFSATGAGCVG